MKRIILPLLCLLWLPGSAQNMKTVDSLLRHLKTCSVDTQRVITLTDIAWEYIGNDPRKATGYCTRAGQLAFDIRYIDGLGLAFHTEGINLYMATRYYESMKASLMAVACYEHSGHLRKLPNVYNNIGNIYWALREYEPAMKYQRKALAMQMRFGNVKGMATSLLNIGLVYSDMNRYDSALYYSFRAEEMLKRIPGPRPYLKFGRVYNNIGMTYRKMNLLDKSLEYYLLADTYHDSVSQNQSRSIILGNIAETYLVMENWKKAEEYYLKKLQLAVPAGSTDDMRMAYEGLAKVSEGTGRWKEAYDYLKKFAELNSREYDTASTRKIAELERKYNTEAGERKIEKLTDEKNIQALRIRQQRELLVAVIAGCLLLVVVFVLIYTNVKQRQSRQRMLSAVIETEERERKRFAEDLHDGLGPLLSSVNLYLSELGSDRHDEKKKAEFIRHSGDILDEAIQSTRSLARNLMPVVLSDYGLTNALRSFCAKLEKSDSLKITFDGPPPGKRYPALVEITLYRVVLELINNTVKHAAASHIRIQLTENERTLVLRYADNGKGFDEALLQKDGKTGLGLGNIRNRIRTVQGKCDISSAPGRGMTALIEINHKKF